MRLLDDLVVGRVGDGAAARDGGEPCPAPGADATLHPVPVHLRRAPASARGHALGEQLEDGLEVAPAELTVRVRAPDQRKELLEADLAARRDGHALLCQDVARTGRHGQRVELSGADRAHRRSRLHQLVPREREEDALRHGGAGMAGAADALDQCGERARRADVADEVDGAASMPSSSEPVATTSGT